MFHHIAWAMKAQTPDALSRWLLVVLADHADQSGLCWPSIATLAKRTGMGTSTVCRKLTMLEDAQLIIRHAGCEGRSTRYRLIAPEQDTPIPQRDNPIPERETKLPINNNNTLTDDWKPSDELLEKINQLAAENKTEINHGVEVIKFISHHQSTGRKLRNIPAAYRKWCANTITYANRNSQKQNGRPVNHGAKTDDHGRRWRDFIGSAAN